MDLDKPISVTQARGQLKKSTARLMRVKTYLTLKEALQLQMDSFEACHFDFRPGELKELEFIIQEIEKEMQEAFKEEARLKDPKVMERRRLKRLKRSSR